MTRRRASAPKPAPRIRRRVRPRQQKKGTPPKRPRPEPVVADNREDAVDPVVAVMLEALETETSLSAREIAERFAATKARPGDGPNLWRRYFVAVKQRALNLAREGRIEIVRKGQVVDPADFKGLVRYRLVRD